MFTSILVRFWLVQYWGQAFLRKNLKDYVNSNIKYVPPKLAASVSVSGIQHIIGCYPSISTPVLLRQEQRNCEKRKKFRNVLVENVVWQKWKWAVWHFPLSLSLYPLACDLSVFTDGVLGIANTLLCMLCHWCIWHLKDSNWETLALFTSISAVFT